MKQRFKKVGYLVYAVIFYLCRVFTRVNKNKVFCIMTHDSSADSNVGMLVQKMQKMEQPFQFVYIKKEDTAKVKSGGKLIEVLNFFLVKPFHMASAGYILLDNIFLPMAYLHFSKKTKVVQLWHGTGTIKKFGQDANEGDLKKLENHANRSITHLIVNADGIREQYAQAFGVSIDKVYATGLPRTDSLFDEDKKNKDIHDFYERYPQLKDKRLVLYAPTFRDQEVSSPKIHLEFDTWIKELPEDCVCLIKLHPFVAKHYELTKEQQKLYENRIVNVSSYVDTNTLLFVADALITDYSSIIYEYCLREKPMIFFAYDLEEFTENGRGFYQSYEESVPGMVETTTEGVTQAIKLNVYEGKYDLERIEWFRDRHYDYYDGKSTERVLELIMEK